MVSCGMPETEYQYFIADLAMNVYRKDIRIGEGYDEIKKKCCADLDEYLPEQRYVYLFPSDVGHSLSHYGQGIGTSFSS